MKKFLSLVLALVMTMSLVTISAGATEYKDFTDKSEIKYEEAVAVLNRLGVITGYSEGDFRPEGELTRGAAAKILVSLLIGPDAATALGNETSPYPDVPAGNTFAGVISYCKTAGLISGYGDGTFRPQGTLTGYAFSKMLLGAIGYKSEYEGFTGSGWNMNVARLGGECGLFDRISFNGNATVTREQACQLALNTLKATMVEYKGGMNISTGDTTMVVKPDREYKLSANKEINQNIFGGEPMVGTGNEYYTVEFGEEHFVDLRLDAEATDRTTHDQFGRPSNKWSFKKVEIGTFPVEPDVVFTQQTEHKEATEAVKNRKTGLGSYKTVRDSNYTNLWLNGELIDRNDPRYTIAADKVSAISDYTDNGTVVEVYLHDRISNFITDVVVMQTQLMEVRRVASDYVALQMYDNGNSDDYNKAVFQGFNNNAMNQRVENVQAEDDCYATLSGMKAGDIVAVVPVTDDGVTYDVADAYAPETVSGAITGLEDYAGVNSSTKDTIKVTVGGTTYNVAVWNVDLHDITDQTIKSTKKDVTLYLDRNGNAMLAKDVGATNDWMVVGAFRQALENGRLVNIVTGWDISGTAVELNIGTRAVPAGIEAGDLVKYWSTSSNVSEWAIGGNESEDVYNVDTAGANEIKASNTQVRLVKGAGTDTVTFDKNVKFIYVNYNTEDGEVESIEVKTTRQNVTNSELLARCVNSANYNPAQACVKDNAVKAVVIKGESNDAIASNMLYVRDYYGSAAYDSTNKMVYGYRVAMNTTNGFEDDVVVYSYDRLTRGDFASYTATENADHSEFYTLRAHNDFVSRTTGTYAATFKSIRNENSGFIEIDPATYGRVNGSNTNTVPYGLAVGTPDPANPTTIAGLVQVSTGQSSLGIGNEKNIVDVKNANFLDLRDISKRTGSGNREIATYDDLKAVMMSGRVPVKTVDVVMIVNDNPSNDGFRQVSMVVIKDSDEIGGNATLKALTAMTFAGTSWGTTGGAKHVTSDEPGGTTAKGRLHWEYDGASIEVKRGTTTLTNDAEITLSTGDVITVKVKDTQGNETAPISYTITVDPADRAPYTNSIVAGMGLTDGQNGYTEAAYTETADNALGVDGADPTSVKLKIDNNNKLTAPVILNGNDADTRAQLTEALNYLGYEVVNSTAGSTWTINVKKGTVESRVTFVEADAKALITVAAKAGDTAASHVVAANLTADQAPIRGVDNETGENGTRIADVSAATVKPGAAYVTLEFTTVGNASASTLTDNGNTFTAVLKVDGNTIADPTSAGTVYVKADSVVTIELTASAAINTAEDSSALVVTFGKAADAVATFVGTEGAVNTTASTATAVTFNFGATTGKTIAAGDKLTATFTVGALTTATAYTLPNVVVSGGAA